jgi:hypothetical protein
MLQLRPRRSGEFPFHLFDSRYEEPNTLLDLPRTQGRIAHYQPDPIDWAFSHFPIV